MLTLQHVVEVTLRESLERLGLAPALPHKNLDDRLVHRCHHVVFVSLG